MRILLVDDHPVVREGYRRLLERQEGYHVVAEAETPADAFSAYRQHMPEIVLLDISLGGESGMEVLRRIRLQDPLARVLMFTMHENVSMAKKALEAGARGYVTKNATPAELLDAIAKIRKGQIALSTDIAQGIAVEQYSVAGNAVNELTSREFDVFRYIVNGYNIDDISKKLNLSVKTIHNHRTQIKSKLDVDTDAQLVLFAMRNGFIDSER